MVKEYEEGGRNKPDEKKVEGDAKQDQSTADKPVS
jgi:hypothetical protein